jgi:hypothetical protein
MSFKIAILKAEKEETACLPLIACSLSWSSSKLLARVVPLLCAASSFAETEYHVKKLS